MDTRTLRTLSLAFAGIAGLSLSISAATDTLKNRTTTGAAAPAAQDTLGKAKSPGMGQAQTPGTSTAPGTATAPGAVPGTVTAPGAVPGTATSPGAAPGMQTAAALTDAEIVGMVNAVDKHEIDAANKALKEKMSDQAMGYARMLKEQHTANMAKTKEVAKTAKIKAANSATSKAFKAKGEAEVKMLTPKDGTEFEKAYIDAMVNGHAEVLQMIDTQLIPNAQNEALKTHLTDVRGHVSAHLEQGKRLQEASASRTE